MNVFFPDRDPAVAAQMMHNKCVARSAMESAQVLSTIIGVCPTHQTHPSVRACVRACVRAPTALYAPPAQAMPEQCRNYYLGEKVSQSRWTRRPVPECVLQGKLNQMAKKKQVKSDEASTPAAADAPQALATAPAVGVRGPKGVELSAKITILAAQNPKRLGSKAHAVFSKYVDGMTVEAFLEANGNDPYTTPNMVYDAAHGFIAIEGYSPKLVEKKEPRVKKEKPVKVPKAKKVRAEKTEEQVVAESEVEQAVEAETID